MDMLESLRASMWIVTIATAFVSVGLAAVLAYHWLKYSVNRHIAKLSVAAYTCISLLLLLAMVTSIPY